MNPLMTAFELSEVDKEGGLVVEAVVELLALFYDDVSTFKLYSYS